MIPSRRERLERLERIGFVANHAATALGEVPAAPMPLDLAEHVETLVRAARAVAELAEREIRFLEESADWEGA
jgi:hypothetical protein